MARLGLSDPGRQRKGSSLNPFSQNIRFLWPWNLSEHELKKEGQGSQMCPGGTVRLPRSLQEPLEKKLAVAES